MSDEVKKNLKEIRKWLRLSQSYVAKYLGKNSKSVISAIETDPDRRIEVNELIQLCQLYHCTPNYVLGFSKNNKLNGDYTLNTRAHSENDLTDHERKEINYLGNFLSSISPENETGFSPSSSSPRVIVEEVLNYFEIDRAPVDIFKIASELGLFVKFSALTHLSGALVHNTETDRTGVLLNSDQPESRIRFSLGHEIAHKLLGHHKNEKLSVSLLGRNSDPQERDADDFSSELLIPYKILRAKIKELNIASYSAKEVYLLSRNFLVSYQAMLLKLYKKNLISRSSYLELKKEKVGELKKLINESFDEPVVFKPESIDEIINSDNFLSTLDNLTPDIVRLVQERACEKYHEETINKQRATEVKVIYEEVVSWLLKKNKVFDLNDPSDYLQSKGYTVIDKREKGGCLWVLNHEEIQTDLKILDKKGFHFLFAENGGKATKKKPAWYLKSSL